MTRPRARLTAVAAVLLALIVTNAASGVDAASWTFDEGTGTVAHDSVGSSDLTLSGATWTRGRSGWATSYDGVSNYASASVDLSGTSVITVAFWLKWNTWANDDKEAMEYTAQWYSNTAFVIDPNGSSGNFEVQVHGNTGFNGVLFARPSAGVWHHYAFVLDFSQASNEVVPYVDGVAVAYTHQWTTNNTNSWIALADETLYVMSRGGVNCWGAGTVDDLHIYKRTLNSVEIAALASGADAFAARWTLSGSAGTSVVANASATLETGEPVHPDAAGGKSLWWTWTAPMDGTLVLTTENSDFDTLLSVHTGTALGSLTLRASNDDDSSISATTSRIEMAVTGGTPYQIRVDGKSGASGTIQLRWAFGPGVGIFRELWTGIAGASVVNLTGNAAYPNSPTSSSVLSAYGDHVEAPHDIADNYGTRMRGWFYAPQTGNYQFQIASDDQGKLYLSTNSDSANAAYICGVVGWSPWRNWTFEGGGQTSANQALTAGSWYYLEALQKEDSGQDGLSIAVTFPDGTSEKPMERVRICPYATQTIIVDKSAIAVPETGTATFHVRLGRVPETATTIAAARSSGDSDVSVSAGSSLVFTSANWNTWQTVTVAAAADGDGANGSAVIRCSGGGLANVDVTATEIDRDVDLVTITSPTVAHVYLPDANEQLILEATATAASHATPTLAWTKQSGPGTVTFSASTAATTTATFSQSGTYVLRLTANASWYAEETVDVMPAGGGDFSSWTSSDIGGPSPTGSSRIVDGTITMYGGGTDIYYNADEFRFAYTPITGDATVIMDVTSQQNTNGWAKIGLMFRDGTAAGAVNYIAALAPNGYDASARFVTNAATTSHGYGGYTVPGWLKLVRSGNDFSSYYSSDGNSWSLIETTTVANMPSTANVGIAITSANSGTGGTATVTHLSVMNAIGASNVAPEVLAGADTTANLNDLANALLGSASDDGLPASPGTLTTTWSKVSGPGTVTFANAANQVTTASFSAAGTYVLRLTGDDGSVKVCDDVTCVVAAAATPIAWYRLDETSGAAVVDSSGNGHGGTLSGGTRETSGAINGALGLGSADHATLDTSSALSPADVTVTFWLRRPVTWASRENVVFWAKASFNYYDLGFFIATKGSTNEPVYICVDGGKGVSATGNIDTFFPLDTWVHVAVTFSSTGPACVIYRNGVSQTVASWLSPQAITANTGTRYLGTPNGSWTSPEYLDDVRVYNGILSQTQIAAIYATGRTLYWNPGGGSSDPSVAGNWSTDAPGTAPVPDIRSTDSLAFSGTGSHADDNCTMAANQSCAGLDFTGYTGTFAFGTSALSASSDVDLRGGAGTPFTGTTGGIAMVGTAAQTLYPRSGKSLPNLTQNGSGGTTLSTVDLMAGNLTVTSGTLTANGRAITLSGAYTQFGGAFVGGSAAMTITGAWSLSGGTFTATSGTMQAATLNQTGGTFTAGSGTVALAASSRQTLRLSDPLNNITFTGTQAVETGLVRWLKLDENGGTSTADAAGSNGGTLGHGTAWSTSTPPVGFSDGASLDFDGVDDDVAADSAPTTPTGTFTMALWAYPTATIPLIAENVDDLSAIPNQRWAIFPTHGSGGQAGTGISIGMNGVIVAEHADFHAPSLATWPCSIVGWTHIAVVFTANRPTIYLNGTAVHTGLQSLKTTFPGVDQVVANPWSAPYKGKLDDLRWYDRALSAAEISELASGCGSGRWILANALDVNGDLQIVSGALDASSYDIAVAGSWTTSGGIFVPRARTVTFDGTTGSKTLTSGGSPFCNLTIAGSGGAWTLGDALTVSGTLAISAGQLDVSGSNFAVKAGTVAQSGGTFVPGTGTVTLSSTANQSVSTISSLYNLNVGVGTATDSATSGLVLHYRLDEGSGTTAADAFTGNGQYALALTGAPTWSTDVPIPYPGARSLCFTADGQYGKLVAAGANRVDPYAYAVDDNFTLALWVKPTATRNSTTQASSGVSGAGGQRYVLMPAQGHSEIDGTNQTTGAGISVGTNGISVFEHTDGHLPSVLVYDATISSWTHVAVVYTARVPTLYVNGTLVATGVASAPGVSHVRAEPLLSDTGYNYGPYRGYVDDVRFYGRSLTGTEVAQLAAGLNVDGRSAATRYTLATDLDCDGSLGLTNGELAASTRTIRVGGNWTDIAGFVCGTSTVILDGGNQTIDGSTTFYNLTKSVTSAATLTFPVGGETQTVTGTLTLAGAAGNRLTLASQSPPTQWRLDPRGTRACNYLMVGNGFNVSPTFINPRNSVDGGNNTRWFTGRGVGIAIGRPLLF